MNTRPILKIVYFLVLLSMSCFILFSFLQPNDYHGGINQNRRALFLDMISGKAHMPFVYRILLPMVIRIISNIVPDQFQTTVVSYIEQAPLLKGIFNVLNWEIFAAFQYLLALILMLLCFMGFGHFVVKLTVRVCNIPQSDLVRILLVVGAFIGLPPFFRYSSYIYDPPQLFLFTLALYYIATHRAIPFFITFIFCCLNKETAVLLIPLYGFVFRNIFTNKQKLWGSIGSLTIIYVCVKFTITYMYQNNPGDLAYFLMFRNITLFTSGWTFTELFVFLSLFALVIFRWQEKPQFLKIAIPSIILPLGILALFFGFFDEWRDYYEAYPIIYGMVIFPVYQYRNVILARTNSR